MTELVQSAFDYEMLPAHQVVVIQQVAQEIKAAARRSADCIREIGEMLIGVKKMIPHGHWESWLDTEFQWSERTARRFMQVADVFKTDTVSDLGFGARVLYELSSPSTPEPVREAAIEMAKAGEPVTAKTVAKLKSEHKEKSQPKPEPINLGESQPEDSEYPEEEDWDDMYGVEDPEPEDEGDLTPDLDTVPEQEECPDAEYEMVSPEENSGGYESPEVAEDDMGDSDPRNLAEEINASRVRCEVIAEYAEIENAWSDYTPAQARYLLALAYAERDWMNEMINDLERIKNES